ncbi:hypothetical protein MKW94_011082 [Papaver nudicaule]|uniref:Rad50/SbcC-type AAA domain-containing protein n=1 Tax=Papaver nudicaule TaxID=74823 RepID=A0AA42AZ36_PAPNU|nr:hypothetical protein [Papaver nudicaule]
MGERSRASHEPRSSAGIITKIHVENFMCHGHMDIQLGDAVNFITGQNGSGKSAILTALCVAFGQRAKGTQRAAVLKDFIKTGCSYALVRVEIKNQGEAAFKPDIYGNVIIVERQIRDSGNNTTVLKNHKGVTVGKTKGALKELVEHFNIDVENPCVIMSQDKSREFLHSGNDKDKFKFFYKATFLEQVHGLLEDIGIQLESASAMIDECETSIRPIVKELDVLKLKIESMENVENIYQEMQQVRKKLAWLVVYEDDRDIQEQAARIEKLKERIPKCQAKIDEWADKVVALKEHFDKKKAQIDCILEQMSTSKRKMAELKEDLTQATKERYELEEKHGHASNRILELGKRASSLEKQIHEFQEQHVRNTQAEASELEEKLKALQEEFDAATKCIARLKEEETTLTEDVSMTTQRIKQIASDIKDDEHQHRNIVSDIRQLRLNSTNKVTAFGGQCVIRLLREIERDYKDFTVPPIGPIGAHINLVDGDRWDYAVETAIGFLLEAFIVTNHGDFRCLRKCAKTAGYHYLKIIIYDFSKPLLNIPRHMLPQTGHPTVLSVLRSENHTVLNVLVDEGSAERQVLVSNYEVGKSVAFDQRISNLKQVITSDGTKMFSRRSVQTIQHPDKRTKSGRLCGSFAVQIAHSEKEASKVQDKVKQGQAKKRDAELDLESLQSKLNTVKRRRLNMEMDSTSKELNLQSLKNSYNYYASEATSFSTPNVDEFQEDVLKIQAEIKAKEMDLEEIHVGTKKATEKIENLNLLVQNQSQTDKEESEAFDEADKEITAINDNLSDAEKKKSEYEEIMQNKVLQEIKDAEDKHQALVLNHPEKLKMASIICPESEVESLGGCSGSTSVELGARLERLRQRHEQESQRCTESLDDLRALYKKKESKISKKRKTYKNLRGMLKTCHNALDMRMSKFKKNAHNLRKELTWQFNQNLSNKGISGHVKVNYNEKTLSLEVKMPQDASKDKVCDTRGLSGGERSFSTLCFALAIHGMTEAPFRAMDEFDVFMDAVSRKISMDTLVEFALKQGSQWIFITPNDISIVTAGEGVKKQQMPAPRS